MLAGPAGGAVALATVQAAQGETVTGIDILANMAAISLGSAVGSEISNPLLAGAESGATTEVSRLLGFAKGEEVSFNEARDAAYKGAAIDAVSGGLDSEFSSSAAQIASQVVKDGTVGSVDNMMEQYQKTGNIDLPTYVSYLNNFRIFVTYYT